MAKLFENIKKDPELIIKFREISGGWIKATAVDSNGDDLMAGNLFRITPEGTIELFSSIGTHIPITPDDNGGGRQRYMKVVYK